MAEIPGCVFCGFDSRYVIAESERSFAAHFDCAVKPGHIVVALKAHVESLSSLEPEQAADIMTLAARVARIAQPLVGCLKFYIVSIADATPHYHIHLLPLMQGDAPIGPHIMGDSGWKGETGSSVGENEIQKFITLFRKSAEES